jgi:exopolyphosphatase/guanosine-5'-triphosphate,3'-diphosphate pyrophosphatase
MRLGVLDVGSNTVHLLVVDARRGAHPTPMTSDKTVLRLAERIAEAKGTLNRDDEGELVRTVLHAKRAATEAGCEDLIAFATSAIREADNAAEVLDRVGARTGVQLSVLPGQEEARFTFLAARRWYGWSAGRLLLLDIGGGSLEMATGIDEDPDAAVSLPLGAGRLARSHLPGDPPSQRDVKRVRGWLEEQLRESAATLRANGEPDRAVATSKTFRSLARLTGAAPSSAGPRVPRKLTRTGLRQLMGFITRMSAADLATLDGVSADRAHQLVTGGLVAEAAMRALSVEELHLCPWALREGVILHRLDHANSAGDPVTGVTAMSGMPQPDQRTGRDDQHGARWRR